MANKIEEVRKNKFLHAVCLMVIAVSVEKRHRRDRKPRNTRDQAKGERYPEHRKKEINV